MNMSYASVAMMWSLIGLVVGYALAKAEISAASFYRRNSVTTPQRLRRRQYIEGIGMIFLGICLVLTTVVSERRDDEQDRQVAQNGAVYRACIVKQVKGIGTYLDSRSSTTEETNKAVDRVITAAAVAFATQDGTKLSAALDAYAVKKAEIAEIRKKTVLPEFPNGECEVAVPQ